MDETSKVSEVAPWILGLYSLAGATFIVAARMAGWYGGAESRAFLFPFVAIFGGVAQFLCAMWAFADRDRLATAMLGTWGSFWMAYGVLNALAATGRIVLPTGAFHELGFWFIALAAITWAGVAGAAAEPAALVATLALFAAGATTGAIGYLTGMSWLLALTGWLLVIGSLAAWYTATAQMLAAPRGRIVLPLGRTLRSLPTTSMPAASPGQTRRVG